MKRMTKRKIGVYLASFLACGCVATGGAIISVDAATMPAQEDLTMKKGAAIRLDDTLEASGIRFFANVSSNLYDTTIGEDGRYDVSGAYFGMVIVPNQYILDFQADANEQTDLMTYLNEQKGGKKIDLHFQANEIVQDENGYTYKGSVAFVYFNNYNLLYNGIGYYYDGSTYKYATFAEGDAISNARSVAKVADLCKTENGVTYTNNQAIIDGLIERAQWQADGVVQAKDGQFTYMDKTFDAFDALKAGVYTVNGTVTGATTGTVIAQNSDDATKIKTAEIQSDGSYSFKLLAEDAGEYDFEFVAGDKVAYALNQSVTSSTTVNATAQDGTYRIADSITLNGNTYRASNQNGVTHTSTVEERAAFAANNEVFAGSTYNVALPNTVAKGNASYIYELTMAGGCSAGDNWGYRDYGFGITNGNATLMVTVRNQYGTLKTVLSYKDATGKQVAFYDQLNAPQMDGIGGWNATKDQADTTLKFVKTADSLIVYRKGNNTYGGNNIHTDYSVMYQIMKDGTIKLADGNSITMTNQPTDGSWETFIASLFDESVEHALTLASSNITGGFNSAYGFYLTSAYSTGMTMGTVSGVTTTGTVLAEQDGKAYTATLNADGTYAISLPDGEYDFEFVAGDKVAYALNQQVSGGAIVNATAVDGTYRIADSITLNGNTYKASNQNGVAHTSTVEERAAFAANNEVFAGSTYNVALPNTVAKGNANYIYELTMAGGCSAGTNWGYRGYGLGITNGNATLMVTVRNQYGTLKTVLAYKDATGKQVAFYDQLNAPQMDGIGGWNATKDQADTTLKFVKTADSLIVYRKGNNTYNGNNIHTDYSIMYQIMKDGTIKLANGSSITMTNQPTDGSLETFIASLFNESKDHALTLASDNITGGFNSAYGFYLTSAYSKNN